MPKSVVAVATLTCADGVACEKPIKASRAKIEIESNFFILVGVLGLVEY